MIPRSEPLLHRLDLILAKLRAIRADLREVNDRLSSRAAGTRSTNRGGS